MPQKHFGPAFSGIHAQELTVGRADLLEKVQNSKGIQILKGLSHVLFQITNMLLGRRKGIIKLDLAGWWLFLLGCGFVKSHELVMDKFESADLSNLTVDSSAVGTMFIFPTLLVDLLAHGSAAHIVYSRSSQFFEKGSAFGLGQQDSGAVLADVLEDGYSESHIADMKSW